MDENNVMENELLSSLEEAAECFREEGIETAFTVGPYGEPGILLLRPKEDLTISCELAETEEGEELYIYRVGAFGNRIWRFPALNPPKELPAFPFLPRIYDALRFGMEENVWDEDLPFYFARTRIGGLAEILFSLGFEVSLSDAAEEGDSGIVPALFVREGEEELVFSYRCIFTEDQLSVLRIECGEDRAYLPEVGGLPDASLYALLLPQVFEQEINEQQLQSDRNRRL